MTTKKLISKFNNKANEWLIDLKNIDEKSIHDRPHEKTWSFSEVYDHVMRVTRSYQIPNLMESMSISAKRKKRKNLVGIATFNLGLRKNVKMRMENFPQPITEAFTPVQRSKAALIQDFTFFIEEVNALEDVLNKSTNEHKQYHPFFGDINTKEWFALIELHIWQHDKQKIGIQKYLNQ